MFFFFKQKTAYVMRIGYWSSDVCSSDLLKPQPALALGAFEVGVLELTGAYAAFANGGYAVQPYGVLEIRDRQGNLLYQRTGDGRVARMINDDALGEINDLLRAVTETGTGRAARLDRPSAGKIGTTSDYRDAWYIGRSEEHTSELQSLLRISYAVF